MFLGVREGRKGIELVRPGNIPGRAGSCTTLQDGKAELTGQGASDKSQHKGTGSRREGRIRATESDPIWLKSRKDKGAGGRERQRIAYDTEEAAL